MRRYYLKVVNGQVKGLLPFMIKIALSLSSAFYRSAQFLYKMFITMGIISQKKLPVPVISIGNITVGGTGKTPCVESMAKYLSSLGLNIAIFSKGYGKHPVLLTDDEELSFEDKRVKRFTHSKKHKLYNIISHDFSPDIVILDDGFQHWRLERDLDIILIDALNPFSNGKVLPAGFLREPIHSLKRADIVIITRTNQVSKTKIERIKNIILEYNPIIPVLEAIHSIDAVKELKTGKYLDLEVLNRHNFLAFCGIGNPIAFRKTLHSLNANVVKLIPFPDHHYYTKNDHQLLNLMGREFMCDAYITTTKDAVRSNFNSFSYPVYTLVTSFKVTKNEQVLKKSIERVLQEYPIIANSEQRIAK